MKNLTIALIGLAMVAGSVPAFAMAGDAQYAQARGQKPPKSPKPPKPPKPAPDGNCPHLFCDGHPK